MSSPSTRRRARMASLMRLLCRKFSSLDVSVVFERVLLLLVFLVVLVL